LQSYYVLTIPARFDPEYLALYPQPCISSKVVILIAIFLGSNLATHIIIESANKKSMTF
jgi:hypothetical protein